MGGNIMIQNEDYEIVNNIDLDIILSDLPIELMKESVKYQIYYPLDVLRSFLHKLKMQVMPEKKERYFFRQKTLSYIGD